MDQDQARDREFQSPPDDLPWIDRCMIDRSISDEFITQKDVATIKIQGSELFARKVRLGDPHIGQ